MASKLWLSRLTDEDRRAFFREKSRRKTVRDTERLGVEGIRAKWRAKSARIDKQAASVRSRSYRAANLIYAAGTWWNRRTDPPELVAIAEAIKELRTELRHTKETK